MSDRERFTELTHLSMSILKTLAMTYSINVNYYTEKTELIQAIIQKENILKQQKDLKDLEEEKQFYVSMSMTELIRAADFLNVKISGMTKNEIIDELARKSLKIKKESGKASSKARAKSPSPDHSYSYTAASSGSDEYSRMSIGQLKYELDKNRISYVGITDKNDLIYLLRQHKLRSKPPTPPPSPKYSKSPTPPKRSPPRSSSPTGTEDAGRVQEDTIEDEFTHMSVQQLKDVMKHYGIPFYIGMFKPDIKRLLRQAKAAQGKTSAKASSTYEQPSSGKISIRRAKEIFRLIDKDGNGRLSYVEFVKFINSDRAHQAPELFSIFGFPERINAEDGSRNILRDLIAEMDTNKVDQTDDDGKPLFTIEGDKMTRIGDGEISMEEMIEWLVKKEYTNMGGSRRTQKNKKNKRKT